MSQQTSIEWTATVNPDGTIMPGATWNPVTGCTEVSPGCDHCYARRFAERFRGVTGSPYEQGFDLKLWPERLELPLAWKKPRRIFANSMSDLFHQGVPDDFIVQVFDTMRRADWHTYQVLTKRPSRLVNTRLLDKLTDLGPWPAHIWLGVSVESAAYTWRIDQLRKIPAPVRFVSAEPLLGPFVPNLRGIHWLIAGAESGPGARPMSEDWVRSLRDGSLEQGVAFFYKQNAVHGRKIPTPALDGVRWIQFPETRKGGGHEHEQPRQ